MLMLVCPCGRSTPLPDESVNLVCLGCSKKINFLWFSAPNAFEKWLSWRIKSGAIAASIVQERERVEFFVTSQHPENNPQ
jgi:hypothetical protein